MGERRHPSFEADQPAATDVTADGSASAAEAPALRDAALILHRAAADEAAASAARERYRRRGIDPEAPDERIAPLLQPGEQVVAIRRSAALDRREPASTPAPPPGLGGDLYVTSRRLVLVGRRFVAFDLVDIEDVVLSGERLFLVMRDGAGVTLDVDWPRLLRVHVAAARAASPA